PVRRMTVRRPVAIELGGPDRIDAKLDPKSPTVVEVKGRVKRLDGFTGKVSVIPSGRPASVPANAVVVNTTNDDFTVRITLPPTTPPGDLKGFRLVAAAVADSKQPNILVNSGVVELTLNVLK